MKTFGFVLLAIFLYLLFGIFIMAIYAAIEDDTLSFPFTGCNSHAEDCKMMLIWVFWPFVILIWVSKVIIWFFKHLYISIEFLYKEIKNDFENKKNCTN